MGALPPARLWSAGGQILERLAAAGFGAWFVGGCVRDRLLGRPVHDIDIATEARPEDIERLFARTIAVGRRFGILRVLVAQEGGTVDIEVATLRRDGPYADGRHPQHIAPGTLAEDAARRDFTVNALYQGRDGRIIDLVGGREDLAARQLRTVGDPAARFSEDRLRILRALRLAAQLGFAIEPGTAAAVRAMRSDGIARERVLDELRKAAAQGVAGRLLALCEAHGRTADIAPCPDPARAAAALAHLGPAPLAAVLGLWLAGLPDAEREAWLASQPLSREERAGAAAVAAWAPRLAALCGVERRRCLHEPAGPLVVAAAAAWSPDADLGVWLAELARPPCPLHARDLIALGYRPGPALGALLQRLSDAWRAGAITSRCALLALARCGLLGGASTARRGPR